MAVALASQPDPPILLIPPRKRWTRAECELLASVGIDTERLELIAGELIDKRRKTRRDVNAEVYLLHWLHETFGTDRINFAAPIDVAPADSPTNEPQPDLIVFSRHGAAFQLTVPQPKELLLVVEIADTTLDFDLAVKAPLYARAGIVEYWVLDVNARRLIVHCDPTPDGYRSVVAYGESESVSPLVAPDRELLVAGIFPD